ncbi:MAG: multidrug transporter [Lachnospiraceae bacterium]|nr:multidrug transporter [Lachnospiraceae bacterium]
MEKEITFLTKPEELLGWVADAAPEFQMDQDGARILLNYMEGHDFRVGIDAAGNMVRVDVSEVEERVESYSLDDLIDAVSEWNFELLTEADEHRKSTTNLIDFANAQARYEQLSEEEQKLDVLFEQTLYGMRLKEKAMELAKKLILGVEEQNLEKAVGMVAECIRNDVTDKGKSR